jgi:uncharacterized membrane protein (UPF0127 family)
MRTPTAVFVCLFLLLTPQCAGEDAADDAGTKPAGPTAVIETDDGPVRIAVEVADTDEERQRGLMNRRSLPEDAGMVFVFESDTSGGFWMKNTLIPLSIAFYDASGKILRILDMEPCRADPCMVYDPGVVYRGALEVNKGAFKRWGVSEGDVLELVDVG